MESAPHNTRSWWGRLGHEFRRCEVLWGNKSHIGVHPTVEQSLVFCENGELI